MKNKNLMASLLTNFTHKYYKSNRIREKAIYIPILLISFSCIPEENKLNTALKLADTNRLELEKVLSHFSQSPSDSLKYKAACFLIENMVGHYSIDPLFERQLRPIYDNHKQISEKYNWINTREWGKEIDELKDMALKSQPWIRTPRYINDLETITATYLIEEIEVAFKGWSENYFIKEISFEDFCHYVLPYKGMDGILNENVRRKLQERNQKYFSGKYDDFKEAIDSLLFQYQHLKHNDFYGASIPVYSFSAMENIQRGLCEHRCWFNYNLLSSVGMPIAIDFVPHWGNRENSHVWNATIIDGETYPFESFWEPDRWKYKKIYDNNSIDARFGKFRLPKVYRHIYAINQEGPIGDKRSKQEDLPPLFRNIHLKDVSASYFETTDVGLKLNNIPANTHYCYLAVYGLGNWHPIQWGKITGDSVTFKDMGRDIVYMPIYYKDKEIEPAAVPFYLNASGNLERLLPSEQKISISTRNVKSLISADQRYDEMKPLRWSYLMGSLDKEFINIDTLFRIQHTLDSWYNEYKFVTTRVCNYIRLECPTPDFSLCEISFYGDKNGKEFRIPATIVAHSVHPIDSSYTINSLVDGLSASGFIGKNSSSTDKTYVDFDLGDTYTIKKIDYVPYVSSNVPSTCEYEIFYWDNGWKSAGTTKGNEKFITFEKVPANALYLVKNNTEDLKERERIFMYKEGMVVWM